MRIVVLRHGKPVLPVWPWIKAEDLGSWIDAYNRAGIRVSAPPMKALNAARTCRIIATSDLARSIGSGRALGLGLPMISEGLLREAELPYASMGNVRMPPIVWAGLFRLLWFFGYHANSESIAAFKERGRRAAGFLISLAHEHDSVLFVGHGLINRSIARDLLAAGWNGPRWPRSRHWAGTEYTLMVRD